MERHVSTVFISYRRGDEPFAVEQLEQYLVQALGADEVFRDTSDIPIGSDFRQAMDDAIERHAVLLPVIGRDWSPHRLADSQDNVRWEIERGLQLGKRIVPVLVGAAPWPRVPEIPPSLAPLVTLTYLPLRPGHDLERDLAAILRELTVTRPVLLRGTVRGRFVFGTVAIRLDGAEVASGPMRANVTFGPLSLPPGEHVLEATAAIGGRGKQSEYRFTVRRPGEWHIELDYQRASASYAFTLTPPA
jgi:hypothetical protein